MARVTKSKSKNLLGETRTKERSKIIKARAKAISSGKTRKQVKGIGGTKKRLKLLGFRTN